MSTIEQFLERFNGNAPADPRAIERCFASSDARPPHEYLRFLTTVADGGEGFIGPRSYAILWRAEELRELNRAYEVAEYAPGLLLFGSNGGGEAFAFDMRSEATPVVAVPFVGMASDTVQVLAPTFEEFLSVLYAA